MAAQELREEDTPPPILNGKCLLLHPSESEQCSSLENRIRINRFSSKSLTTDFFF